MSPSGFRTRLNAIMAHYLPPGQFGRYLLVGAGNTLFGYGSYALFTAILTPVMAHGYIVAAVMSSLLNITVSFLGYKLFVFKTRGHYLREWVRCVGVYSGGIFIGVITLPILVALIRHNTRFFVEAPYIAGALLTTLTALYGFLGHKHFSFRSPA